MKAALKRKWLKALRSGKYIQGVGTLRQKISNKKFSFCCLGVLCDVQGAKWKVPGKNAPRWNNPIVRTTGNISYDAILDRARFGGEGDAENLDEKGFSEKMGLTRDQIGELMNKKDDYVPFTKIADWIEENI